MLAARQFFKVLRDAGVLADQAHAELERLLVARLGLGPPPQLAVSRCPVVQAQGQVLLIEGVFRVLTHEHREDAPHLGIEIRGPAWLSQLSTDVSQSPIGVP